MTRAALVRPLAFAIALAAAPALGQVPPAKHAQAEEQFRQGREAQNKGDYRRALDLLEASQAIEPGRGKLINIAICEAELSLVAHAVRHFEEVLPQLQAGDERLPIVQKRLADLRARVAALRIEAPAGDARVEVDGEAVPASALAGEILVDPGKHTVSVQGRPELRLEVELKTGERRSVRLAAAPEPEKPAEPPPPPVEAPPSNTRRIAGFIVGGAGVAGLVVGAGTGIASIVDHGKAASACPSHTGCSAGVLSTASQGKSLAIASTATFITGAALAGVGAFLIITGSRGAPKATTGLVLLPGGARIEGRF